MRFNQPWLAIVIVFFLFCPQLDATENWPEFRGPTGDGQADGSVLPTEIDESAVAWKIPIHG